MKYFDWLKNLIVEIIAFILFGAIKAQEQIEKLRYKRSAKD